MALIRMGSGRRTRKWAPTCRSFGRVVRPSMITIVDCHGCRGHAPDEVRVNVRSVDKPMHPLIHDVKKDKDFDPADYIRGVLEADKLNGKVQQVNGKLGPQVP